jgi:hypothetical protein
VDSLRRCFVIVATIAMLGTSIGPARAGIIITAIQQGPNVVVFSGSGTADITDLTMTTDVGMVPGQINPIAHTVLEGPTAFESVEFSQSISGPLSFGMGGGLQEGPQPFSGSGELFGIGDGSGGPGGIAELVVPNGYVSGTMLSGAVSYSGTFSSLGITPGTYVWSWGTGADADSLTLNIVETPEPASLTLLSLGAAGLLGYEWRRKRAA